jgi:tetratricopeptide (TPR) repeat protein
MPRLRAQSAPPTPNNQPANQQKPDAAPPKPSGSNQFPEDTSAVPVVPTSDVPAAPPPDVSNDGATARLPGEDADPVRSPDDPAPDAKGSDGFSSSLQGADELKPIPDEEKPGKHAKGTEAPTHTEGAAGDINIGGYYLERKNWRAALSRFESALVLDPENPEVYWGMAEAQSHLGDYVKARENYKKLLEYDPDGKHGKEARKALKEPQIANAH